MELRHLRYVLAVADERHFGRAADRLHIAQPPLSQQIKQLEAELGVRLFERTTRRVELTPAGARFVERARAILAAADRAADEAQRIAAGHEGTLSVGFTGSASYRLMPQLARAVRRALPGIELRLHGEQLTPRQVASLTDGTIDLGFLRPPVNEPALVTESLASEPLVAAVPDTHPLAGMRAVSLTDLASEPFVGYPSRGGSVVHDEMVRACASAGFTPRFVVEVTETASLVSFVAAGIGVALVPASVSDLALTGVRYLPIDAPPRVELAAAYRADDDSPHLQAVLQVVREHFSVGERDV